MSWISNIDKHRISDLYVQMSDGLHRAVDAYVMESDGLHKWARVQSAIFAILDSTWDVNDGFETDGTTTIYYYDAEFIEFIPQTTETGHYRIDADPDNRIWIKAVYDENQHLGLRITTTADMMAIVGKWAMPRGINMSDWTWLQYLDTSQATNFNNLLGSSSFYEKTALTSLSGVEAWDVRNVTEADGALSYLPNLLDLSPTAGWRFNNLTKARHMFWFSGITSLAPTASWGMGSLTDAYYMCYSCPNLTDIDAISNWNTSHVTNWQYAFSKCPALRYVNMKIDTQNTAAQSVNMNYLFYYDAALEEVKLTGDFSHVRSMYYAFCRCTSLRKVDLSGLDFSGLVVGSSWFSASSVTEIVTPAVYPASVTIGLPATFTDGTTTSSTMTAFPPNTLIRRVT